MLSIVLLGLLIVFGGQAAQAKDHDHRKCREKHHGKKKVVYVYDKHRSHDDHRRYEHHRDRRHADRGRKCCQYHDSRRSDSRWERDRDYDYRRKGSDRRYPYGRYEHRDRSQARVVVLDKPHGNYSRY